MNCCVRQFRATNLLWEINGTAGDIRVTAEMAYPQIAELSISGARGDEIAPKPLLQETGAGDASPLPAAVRIIAAMYRLVVDDIRTGNRSAPSLTTRSDCIN